MTRHEIAILLLIIALGALFFAVNVPSHMAPDSIQFLNGEYPGQYDRYRVMPMLVLRSIGRAFGGAPIPTEVAIFAFHGLNTFLVYLLALGLLESRAAAKIAATAFCINPLTLGTLTWIACFSYVLGATFALIALLAFWRGFAAPSWRIVVLTAYGAALFSSHEVFFLPLIFVLMCWHRRQWSSLWVPGIGLVGAVLVWQFVYLPTGIGDYGMGSPSLFSLRFLATLASSAMTFGPAMAIAYPLSFLIKITDVLVFLFPPPVRVAIAVVSVPIILLLVDHDRRRLWLTLCLAFAIAIIPYAIRLYLQPPEVAYASSYVLGGRLFYWPFAFVAIGLALVTENLLAQPQIRRFAILAAVLGFIHALALYSPADFSALERLTAIRHNIASFL